jgi:class 3 adenylate cyclase
VAARIAGAAQAAEILVSHATLDVTRRRYDDTGRRDIALRGVSAPVEVVAVAWH